MRKIYYFLLCILILGFQSCQPDEPTPDPSEPTTPSDTITPIEPTTPSDTITPIDPPTPSDTITPIEPPTPSDTITPIEPPTPSDTVITVALSGTANVLSTAGRTSCEWVQLWAGGPKWATFNVGATITDYANLSVGADATLLDEHPDLAPYYNTANLGGLYAWKNPNANGRQTTWDENISTGISDVATTLWGSKWKTPSREQLDTLYITGYEKIEWTWCDGSTTQYVAGCTLVGYKVSGVGEYADQCIFLPAAGNISYERRVVSSSSIAGYYWSNTPSAFGYSPSLYFYSGGSIMGCGERMYGHSVRAILAE